MEREKGYYVHIVFLTFVWLPKRKDTKEDDGAEWKRVSSFFLLPQTHTCIHSSETWTLLEHILLSKFPSHFSVTVNKEMRGNSASRIQRKDNHTSSSFPILKFQGCNVVG